MTNTPPAPHACYLASGDPLQASAAMDYIALVPRCRFELVCLRQPGLDVAHADLAYIRFRVMPRSAPALM